MFKYPGIASLCLLFVLSACTPSLRSLEKNLTRKHFIQTRIQLLKRADKLPTDPGARLLEARFYADSANADFQIDTAYALVRRARRELPQADEKQQKELEKMNWTDSSFIRLQRKLERDAFAYFRRLDTESGYQDYRDRFAEAPEKQQAKERQHLLAFEQAADKNTYQAYQNFFEKYPDAEQVKEARARYEILLFQEKTKDNSLSSYEKFLEQYPGTPYRREIEKRIYELFVRDAEPSTYENFIEKYPKNQFVNDAWEWLWWLAPEKAGFLIRYSQVPDRSGFQARLLRLKACFFPFGKGQQVGFVSHDGIFQVSPQAWGTSEEVRCQGSQQKSWLPLQAASGKVGAVALSGEVLLDTLYDEIAELGTATLKACRKESGCRLFRKDGQAVTQAHYQDLQALESGFITFAQHNRWGLLTQNGREVFSAGYDQITDLGANFIQVHKSGRKATVSKAHLLRILRGEPLEQLYFWRDLDWKQSHDTFAILRRGSKWGVQHLNGKQIVDFVAEEIRETPKGWAVFREARWSLFDFSGKEIFLASADRILIDQQGFGVRVDGKWGAISPDYRTTIKPEYDSLQFIRGGGLLWQGRKKFIFFQGEKAIDISAYKNFGIQKGTDGEPFLVVENRYGRKGVLDASGRQRVSLAYDEITISGAYAVVERYKKRGLVRLSDEKTMLNRQYEGLVAEEGGYFSLLKGRRFGLYHPEKEQYIEAKYDERIEVFDTADLFVARRDKHGLIDKEGKTILPFRYDEIRYWQDSAAWVMDNEQWFLQPWGQDREALAGPFLSVRITEPDARGQRFAFTYGQGKTALWSNKKGQLVGAQYEDIWNLGTAREPLFWAENALPDGSWQIDYLDKTGKIVFSQKLSEALYERLVCD